MRISRYINMLSIHVSWRRCTPTHPEELGVTGTRDEGWPVVVISAVRKPAGTERQWQAPDVEEPGGIERRMSPPITTYPRVGEKTK